MGLQKKIRPFYVHIGFRVFMDYPIYSDWHWHPYVGDKRPNRVFKVTKFWDAGIGSWQWLYDDGKQL